MGEGQGWALRLSSLEKYSYALDTKCVDFRIRVDLLHSEGSIERISECSVCISAISNF